MRLRTTPGGLIAEDPLRGRWGKILKREIVAPAEVRS
jgi:hypothetical protein